PTPLAPVLCEQHRPEAIEGLLRIAKEVQPGPLVRRVTGSADEARAFDPRIQARTDRRGSNCAGGGTENRACAKSFRALGHGQRQAALVLINPGHKPAANDLVERPIAEAPTAAVAEGQIIGPVGVEDVADVKKRRTVVDVWEVARLELRHV